MICWANKTDKVQYDQKMGRPGCELQRRNPRRPIIVCDPSNKLRYFLLTETRNSELGKPEISATMEKTMLNGLISVLVALLLVSSSALASSDAPFIVAHKKATLTRLKSGSERVSVSIDIYNQGSVYVICCFLFVYVLLISFLCRSL